MKNIIIDFTWNGNKYGHKDIKKNNGRLTKYYKNGAEITADEFVKVAEKYSKIFRS